MSFKKKKTHLRIIYLRSVHAFTITAKIYHRQWMLIICKTPYKINNKHYSSVNAAGRFVDGSAERRTGLVKDSLTSSSTSSVIVAENNIVCLLFGQRRTWKFLNENEGTKHLVTVVNVKNTILFPYYNWKQMKITHLGAFGLSPTLEHGCGMMALTSTQFNSQNFPLWCFKWSIEDVKLIDRMCNGAQSLNSKQHLHCVLVIKFYLLPEV